MLKFSVILFKNWGKPKNFKKEIYYFRKNKLNSEELRRLSEYHTECLSPLGVYPGKKNSKIEVGFYQKKS